MNELTANQKTVVVPEEAALHSWNIDQQRNGHDKGRQKDLALRRGRLANVRGCLNEHTQTGDRHFVGHVLCVPPSQRRVV